MVDVISNSYVSINCIRFEGMISALNGHPFVFTLANIAKKTLVMQMVRQKMQ